MCRGALFPRLRKTRSRLRCGFRCSTSSPTGEWKRAKGGAVKALVYHGPGQRAWDEVPAPTIQQATDVVVKIDAATICGADLHILKGDVPEWSRGRASATRRSARSSR